jgi:predicted transcriptional regulator
MARVNVFLPDQLLQAIDAEANESHIGRSTLVQSALARYLDAIRRERDQARLEQEMNDACRGMDALAEKLGPWDPVKMIREFRETRAMTAHEPRIAYRPGKGKGKPRS